MILIKIKQFLPLLFILLACHAGISQQKEMREAYQDYNDLQFHSSAAKYQDAINKMKEDDYQQRNFATFMLGECYRMMNDYEQAEIFYQQLLESDFANTNPAIYLRWANILRAKGEFSKAKEYYKKYLKEDSQNQSAKMGVKSCDWLMANEKKRARINVSNVTAVNSPNDDFAPVFFSAASDKMVLTSNRAGATGKKPDEWWGAPFSDLFVSTMSGNTWTTPGLLDNAEVINTEVHEGTACFNEDFSRMYFTRCERWEAKKRYCAILVAEMSSGSWGEPEILFADTNANFGQPSVSKDELTIVFSSNMKDGEGGKDIYMAKRPAKDQSFGKPVAINAINSFGNEMFPHLYQDTILFFASDGYEGYGGLDLFKSVYRHNAWSRPENLLRPVNSGYDDYGILVRVLNEEGYFTSNRPAGAGGDDIYQFTRRILLFTLSGQVKDNMTLLPLANAQVILTGAGEVQYQVLSDAEGRFHFNNTQVLEDSDYKLAVRKENYFADLQEISTRPYEDDLNIIRDVILEPIPEKPIVLPDILYPLDQWILLPQYQDSLRGLVKLLNENPNLVIELRSHTDSRASYEYNDVLSQKRAQSVVDFLVTESIDPGRMVAKGYGERVFRVLDKDITREGYTFKAGSLLNDEYVYSLPSKEIQEAAFQLNRRTEFAVIAKDYKPSAGAATEQRPVIEVVSDSSVIAIPYTLSSEGKMLVFTYLNDFRVETVLEKDTKESFIDEKVVLDLLRKGAINRNDFEGSFDEIMMDGHIAGDSRLTIAKVRLGELVRNDVHLIVKESLDEKLLMGSDLLSGFGESHIDSEKQQLIFK